MKFILIISILLTTVTGYPQTIKIGYFQGYPSNYYDAEREVATGSTIEYLRDYLKEIGYDPNFIGPLPFPRLFDMLKKGEIDALLGLSYLPEREEFVLYPDQPYRVLHPYVFVKKESDIRVINSIEDMKEFSYAYRQGGALPDFVRENEDQLTITYLSKDNWIDRALEMLMLGRVEGIITTSTLSVEYAARDLGIGDKIRKVLIPGKSDPLYLGISKESELGEEVLERYNWNLLKTELEITVYDSVKP